MSFAFSDNLFKDIWRFFFVSYCRSLLCAKFSLVLISVVIAYNFLWLNFLTLTSFSIATVCRPPTEIVTQSKKCNIYSHYRPFLTWSTAFCSHRFCCWRFDIPLISREDDGGLKQQTPADVHLMNRWASTGELLNLLSLGCAKATNVFSP